MSIKNKILFLGCNNDQLPYLQIIRILGYEIIGTDINPEAPGKKFCDKFHVVSYQDSEGLIKVGELEGFTTQDHVFTAASHFALEGASKFAEHFKIKFVKPEIIDALIDKSKLYKLLSLKGIDFPNTKYVSSKEELLKAIRPGKTYYLKSDYGKSPKYIYKFDSQNIPEIHWEKDNFFRKWYVLQEEVIGAHYRIDYCNGKHIFFKRENDFAIPLNNLKHSHSVIQWKLFERINRLCKNLEIENFIVKIDIIVPDNSKMLVLDIGLDPPKRLEVLSEKLGFDFKLAMIGRYLGSNLQINPIPWYPDEVLSRTVINERNWEIK